MYFGLSFLLKLLSINTFGVINYKVSVSVRSLVPGTCSETLCWVCFFLINESLMNKHRFCFPLTRSCEDGCLCVCVLISDVSLSLDAPPFHLKVAASQSALQLLLSISLPMWCGTQPELRNDRVAATLFSIQKELIIK